MTTPTPLPYTLAAFAETRLKHCTLNDIVQTYGKAEYERGLLDAMNATRAFGKTGEVIAVIIAALKEKKA